MNERTETPPTETPQDGAQQDQSQQAQSQQDQSQQDQSPTAPAEGRGIHLTERAAKEIGRVISEHKFADTVWVRIGAKGGGCSGFSYVLDFDQSGPTEFDLAFEMHGVRYCVDKKSEFFMGGTILDFNDGLLDRGFVFKNPQAKGTCGCGTSFSA